MDICTKPKNALVKQYRKFFEFDGVELIFTEGRCGDSQEGAPGETGAWPEASWRVAAVDHVRPAVPLRHRECVVTKRSSRELQADVADEQVEVARHEKVNGEEEETA